MNFDLFTLCHVNAGLTYVFSYRRNSSCGKVMISQACIISSVHKGGGMHGGGACVVVGKAWGGHAWQGVCMAGETVTTAEGTHPTGMHSCLNSI